MIVIRTIMNVLPEKHKEIMQTLLSMIVLTEKEKGCLSYDVFYNAEDNHVFNVIEEWETRQDLDDHIKSHRFGVLLGSKSLLPRPMEMKIYTVSHSEGVEAVSALRGKGIAKKSL